MNRRKRIKQTSSCWAPSLHRSGRGALVQPCGGSPCTSQYHPSPPSPPRGLPLRPAGFPAILLQRCSGLPNERNQQNHPGLAAGFISPFKTSLKIESWTKNRRWPGLPDTEHGKLAGLVSGGSRAVFKWHSSCQRCGVSLGLTWTVCTIWVCYTSP